MKYPDLYERYRDSIRNTWTVEEVDFSRDVDDLRHRFSDGERHMINRLVAFFATGDSIVANNLVLNLYQHINAPEARMFLSRQLYEEALHVQFYLTLLDTYLPDPKEREKAFAAVENIPSIKRKADFCFRWIDSINQLHRLETADHRQAFLLNLICFAACIEGLFFFGAFAYVYFLRSKGLLQGLSTGTNWVFRDETCVPEYTDVLTIEGWMPVAEAVEKRVRIAQVHDDQSITWVLPRAWVVKDFDGDLVDVSTKKSVSFQVTPDHGVVTKSSVTGRLKREAAKDLKFSSIKLLPTAGQIQGSAQLLSAVERLAIAFQADGSRSERYDGSRCGTIPVTFKLKKARKIERLKAILEETQFSFKVQPVSQKQTEIKVAIPVEYASLFSKNLDWVDLSLVDVVWGRAFIEELGYWDSYKAADRTCIQYTNTNLAAIEKVQAVATLCGFTANKYSREDPREARYRTVYNLYISDKTAVKLHKAKKKSAQYQGKVYCPNVPAGRWVMRQNGKPAVTGNCHMSFAFEIIETVRKEEPELWTPELEQRIRQMLAEAIECEVQFAEDLLKDGIPGLTVKNIRAYLEFTADQHFGELGMTSEYGTTNPLTFMELQNVQEIAQFFERRVSAYQVGLEGDFDLAADF